MALKRQRWLNPVNGRGGGKKKRKEEKKKQSANEGECDEKEREEVV